MQAFCEKETKKGGLRLLSLFPSLYTSIVTVTSLLP